METIILPAPVIADTGMTVMQALKGRYSSRHFSPEALPLQTVSEMLWSMYGITRPKSGHRTAPSAHSYYPLVLYVFLTDGVWLYDPRKHALEPVLEGDRRKAAGMQPYVAEAPMSVVIYADYGLIRDDDPVVDAAMRKQETQMCCLDAGTCIENGALYAVSHGLNYVPRLMFDSMGMARLVPETSRLHFVIANSTGLPDPGYRPS